MMIENQDSILGYGRHVMDEFQFESGTVLHNVQVEYKVSGTPKFDENGKISNAVIFCHRFNGNYSSIDDIYQLTGRDGALSEDEFCFFSITSLGFPESCSPSNTGLKFKFPSYTIKDCVDFKRQFLVEKFGIEKVMGIIGRGLGGYEVYTWACDYPDEMDFIIVVSSSFKTNGYRYVVSRGMESMIDATDDFYSDVYNHSLSRVMVSINKVLYSKQFSKKMFQKMSNDEIDVLMEDYVDEGLFMDIYDFKYRNDSIIEYDVEDKLKNIKAKTLVVSSDDDIYYTPEFDVFPLKGLIEDCTILIIDSEENYDLEDFSIIDDDVKKFLDDLKN